MGQLVEGRLFYIMPYMFYIDHGKDVVPLKGPAKPWAIFAASSAYAEPEGLDPNSACVSWGLSWVRSVLRGTEWEANPFNPNPQTVQATPKKYL